MVGACSTFWRYREELPASWGVGEMTTDPWGEKGVPPLPTLYIFHFLLNTFIVQLSGRYVLYGIGVWRNLNVVYGNGARWDQYVRYGNTHQKFNTLDYTALAEPRRRRQLRPLR